MHRHSKIRILLIGKNRPFAQSVRDVLRAESDLDVVSFADSLAQAATSAPDCHVAIIDAATYPPNQLLTLLQDVNGHCKSLKMITVGAPSAPEALVSMIEAGVAGYLGTSQMRKELAQTVRLVHQHQARLSPEVTSMVMSRLSELHRDLAQNSANTKASPEFLFDLTAREQEVLTLVSQGRSNREIAEDLIIEYGTAKNHVHNILRKLNVNSRDEAAKLFSMVGQDAIGASLSI